MYKRQKRRHGYRRRRGKKQRGGFIYGRTGGVRNLAPFKILRAVKAIHDFSKQKGVINKTKFAYNKLK